MVRKYWPIVAACVTLTAGASLLYSKSATKIYESKALIDISAHVPQPLGDSNAPALDIGAGLLWDNHEYYETQYKILASDRVLSGVVRDLGLANDAECSRTLRRGKPAGDTLRTRPVCFVGWCP